MNSCPLCWCFHHSDLALLFLIGFRILSQRLRFEWDFSPFTLFIFCIHPSYLVIWELPPLETPLISYYKSRKILGTTKSFISMWLIQIRRNTWVILDFQSDIVYDPSKLNPSNYRGTITMRAKKMNYKLKLLGHLVLT